MIDILTRTLLLATLLITGGYAGQDSTPAIAPPVKETNAKPMLVAGFTIRTTNAAESTGDGGIPKLWMRFFQEHLAEQIPHRIGQTMMVVYSDYASDEKGEYTYLLGLPVDSIEGLPKDMAYREIPAGNYAVITSPKGRFQDVLPVTWMKIWSMSAAELGGKRAFLRDYEVYEPSSSDPGTGQVVIHVGLAPAAK